ncbi:MAG: glucose-1-phosphate thymidylyltransferase [Actinomycetota bacterium]
MRALILAGGEGSRLRPITHTNAKQLIPIANKPILFYGLEAIRDAGIREVGIVTGPTASEIAAAVGDGSAWGVDITFIPQEAPLGLAHAVKIAEPFLRGEPFVMYLGDNVLLEGVTRFVQEFERHGPDAQILLIRVPEPERFGVAVLDGDRVARLVEKPTEHVSDLALVGVYLFGDSVFDAVNAIEPSDRGELEITDAIQWLVDNGRNVRAEMVTGWWKDTGRPEDLLEANEMMLSLQAGRVDGDVDDASQLSGEVVVERGAKVVRSEIRGPAVIGSGAVIEDSIIGPNASIAAGCSVRDCEVVSSVVMDGGTIEGVRRLVDSLLGNGVEVRRPAGTAVADLRLVVGDHGRIEAG